MTLQEVNNKQNWKLSRYVYLTKGVLLRCTKFYGTRNHQNTNPKPSIKPMLIPRVPEDNTSHVCETKPSVGLTTIAWDAFAFRCSVAQSIASFYVWAVLKEAWSGWRSQATE